MGGLGQAPEWVRGFGDVPSVWEILGAVPSALAVGQREDFPQDNNADFSAFPSTPTSRERGGMARRSFTSHPGCL